MFCTKIGALPFGDLEILSDLGRDIHTYVRTYKKVPKKISFFCVFRNQGVMKRGEMRKKFFRFLDRLPYFPFYRSSIIELLF